MTDRPVAGRLRRPGWRDPRLLVGLVLIALSVVGVNTLVRASATTVPVLEAREVLPPGTVLGPDDVRVVEVRVPGGAYLPGDAEPWGMVVTRTIGKGELIPNAALASADAVTSRPVAVQAAVPLATDIGPGCAVDIYLTSQADGDVTTEKVASSLVVDEVVSEDGAFSSQRSQTVYVVVPTKDIEELLDAIATEGDIAVVGVAGCS